MSVIHDGKGEIPREVMVQANELFERGLYLQAYESTKTFGPLTGWRGPEAGVMAARLANHLGASNLSARITARAARRYPEHAGVRYYHGYTILEWRGPLQAWKYLLELGDMPGAEPKQQADLYALRSQTAGVLRDFQTAEHWLLKADEMHPGDPWLALQRAHLLEYQDRYEEALVAAQAAMKLHPYPYYRAGTLAQAHLLQLLNRDREALALLREASAHLESSAVETLLFALQVEMDLPAEALKTLERYEKFTPLRPKGIDEWLRSQRCRMMHLTGNREEALRLARTLEGKFHAAIASRLEDPQHEPRRVVLPVGFVRQNYKTCAPATLAALGRYWKSPTDHLQLVTEICYDGTPPVKQREWAEKNGWAVREFKLTWEAGVKLLDLGIPFAVSTVETGSAHLQAIVGYDTTRGTFLVRDPYNPYLREAEAETFLEYYANSGPRCFAMVPAAQAEMLRPLLLPEAELYDLEHGVELALCHFDRDAAAAALRRMEALDPAHRLVWWARRSLAYHDGDLKEAERCVEELHALFPKDGNLLLNKISFLRNGAREPLLKFLTDLCKQKEAEPVFHQQLAGELLNDARQEREAERLLLKCLHQRPYDAGAMHVLADLRWQQRKFEEAYDLYRFAASLEDKREEPTRALFAVSRHLRRHHEVMGYLRDRFQRFGRYSHLSLVTLFWAEVELSETAQAFKHLGQALEWRPMDGGLLCFAADVYARFGNYAEAAQHLEAARGRTRWVEWHRASAQLASQENKPAVALASWQEVLKVQPMARDAHAALLDLVAGMEGPQAIHQHLETLRRDFPHNIDLLELVVAWWRRDNLPEAIATARKIVELHPANSWARRELADLLAEDNQHERAMQEVATAMQIEPNSPFGYCVRGYIYRRQQRCGEAAEDFRQALRLSVDNDFAQRSLVDVCVDHAEKRAALEFIQQELLRQVILGTGLVVFRDLAHPVMEPGELAAFLRKAHQERPDLWQSWSALIQQLCLAGKLHEAGELAKQAVARFPLSPRMWLDNAQVQRLQDSLAAEIECLETANSLNPLWPLAARELAEAYERAGDLWKARRLMEAVVVHHPLDGSLHELLAHYTWKTGDRDEALSRLRKGLEVDPGMSWSWEKLEEWGKDRGHPGLALETARKLVGSRGGEARSWLLLSQQLEGPESMTEREAALEKALQLQPRSLWAHISRIELLTQAERWEEALKMCRPPVFEGKPPRELLRMEARVERMLGNNARSMTLLNELLEKHPDYLDGWRLKAGWHNDADELEQAAKAADWIARLDPLDPVAWGYKGASERARGRKEAAIACFRRGYELTPGYTYAGFQLFDLLLETGDTAQAAEVLHSLRKHTPGPGVLCRDISLAGARAELHRVPDLLTRLAQAEEVPSYNMEIAWEVASRAGLAEKAMQVLQQCVLDGSANPSTAELWMKLQLREKKWGSLYLLAVPSVPSPLKAAALAVWLAAFLEDIEGREDMYLNRLFLYRRLKKCLDRFGTELQADPQLWATVARTFINLKRHADGMKWVAGWRDRKGLEFWMVANICTIGERAGDEELSIAAYLAGAKMAGREPYAARVLCRAAIEKALAGEVMEAEEFLARTNCADLDDYQKVYERLARLLITTLKQPGHRPAECDRNDLVELAGRRKQRPFDVRLFKRIVRSLSQRPASRWIGWQLWWRRYWPAVVIAGFSLLIIGSLIRVLN